MPDPVLDDPGYHFKLYESVKSCNTNEDDRPSLKIVKKLKPVAKTTRTDGSINVVSGAVDQTAVADQAAATDAAEISGETDSRAEAVQVVELPFAASTMCSVQNARSCIECRKPRVIYAKQKLSERENVLFAVALSEIENTCGAALLPPDMSLSKRAMLRANLSCAVPIEVHFYGSSFDNDLGNRDLCVYCSAEGSETDQELRKQYKTVLPMCQSCKALRKMPVVQRSYGKLANNI